MQENVKTHLTLIEALQGLYPDSSKSTLRSWIKNRRVLIDGKVVEREKERLEPRQEVHVEKKRQNLDWGVVVLYEDHHLIVVDKPEGLLSVATEFKKEHTLHALLKSRPPYGRIYPVHRLDRDTSGVLVFAKSEQVRGGLKKQFEKHSISRTYNALVEGSIASDSGTWESCLIEDKNYHVRSVSKGGKRAVTHYRVLNRTKDHTLLELQLETGRKNQIRVHCSEGGHPIVGDKKYGACTNPYKRLCLHAATLEFEHPHLGKRLSFTSKQSPQFLIF